MASLPRPVALIASLAVAPLLLAQPPATGAPPAAPRHTTARPERGATDLETYRQHLTFLANPFMEGRGPGTRGNATAADYLEFWFDRLGLERRFPAPLPPEYEGKQWQAIGYRQPFTAGQRAEHRSSSFSYEGQTYTSKQDIAFDHGVDYSALGFSGNAAATGPVVFVGYSIAKGGPDGGYSSYADGDDLTGKIALILRFEPMDAEGRSRWRTERDGKWTPAAAIAGKVRAAVDRGAAGIIVVSPPGTDDARAASLETIEGTTGWMRPLDVPAVMLRPEAADKLVREIDPAGRSLLDLRRTADEAGGVTALGDRAVTLSVELDRSPRQTWNIAGVLPGRSDLADQYLIIGAHYDHVGYGYTGGSVSNELGVIHPGADDNASGAAGLLLVAEQLARAYEDAPADQPLRSVMFIGFSAEEMGLVGSREFVKNSPVEAGKITAMLNMDMIGRLRNNRLEVAGTGTAEGFEDLLRPLFDASGLTVKTSPGGQGPSDHASFYGAGIPVLHFFTGLHDAYHTPRDTVDTINFEGAVQTADLVTDVAMALAARPGALAFTPTGGGARDGNRTGRSMADVKVRFGIAPGNYADGEAGVLVGDVYDGTSAAEAGIQPGDRLARWNGKEIDDVANWMEYLAEHKPGDVVDVTVRRNGEEQVIRVTLKSRDQAPK